VAFNARLREESDRVALSDGLVGMAGHHAAQAHHLVAVARDVLKGRADALATTYSPEYVEGTFCKLRVDGVLRSSCSSHRMPWLEISARAKECGGLAPTSTEQSNLL